MLRVAVTHEPRDDFIKQTPENLTKSIGDRSAMITPQFSVRQDDEYVYIDIKVVHLKVIYCYSFEIFLSEFQLTYSNRLKMQS